MKPFPPFTFPIMRQPLASDHKLLRPVHNDIFPVGTARLHPCPLPASLLASYVNLACNNWSKLNAT